MTEKVSLIIKTLEDMFPDAKAELNYQNPFELLIAVVLSAQTTDVAVNKVTPSLFAKYPDPKTLSEANLSDVESLIKTIGLYRNKAKNIISLAKDIHHIYSDLVPSDRGQLEALAGVGRKTANVVLSNAFDIPALAVDTHVSRVSKRLGLAKETDDVYQVEMKLNKKIPKKYWLKVHHQMIFFGRYHCKSQKPACQKCPLFDVCVYKENKKN